MGERNQRGVCHQWHTFTLCHPAERHQVHHLHLRIGDHLGEEGTALPIDMGCHLLRICQVAETHLHTEGRQCIDEERVSVAKKVA